MTNADREAIMWHVADATGNAERKFQLACGASHEEAYLAEWVTTAVTYKMLLADHRPAVHLEARTIIGKGLP